MVIMLIDGRLWETMPILDKWIQVLRPRIFFDLETSKASTWNSTSALIAEPVSFPETSLSAEIHRVMYKHGSKLIYTASNIKICENDVFTVMYLISARKHVICDWIWASIIVNYFIITKMT